ncbi:SAM-dependent methyltransferase [Geobacillus sp. 46C-IIa]|uniref:class I SAM-dependent DNA methyltransferase n=1 Tax=Geobacillus sp. 46C-IIa TaxID=1963025 RepID=UPI0009C1037D|nr:class I SAM-dependent methyltransferase [Geobacillus sp. 46C-IIa]OQP06239.1 SAM-dependent methyltransferase [Geobacillus sp. 46C-IIa]QNU28777.1 class I SAM-dependent methyltransferase [Geobacillus sp. 46C-IIa]
MTYARFADWYDALMAEAPYDKWRSFVERAFNRYAQRPGRQVIDIGCGTGELAIRLAKAGWQVSGVDLSEHMLAIAQEKAEEAGVHVPFFEQNMAELDGFSDLDGALIFCDALNYLTSEEDVQNSFAAVSRALGAGGLLLFDVHSVYKMDVLFRDAVFADQGEDISYIWTCHPLDWPHSVGHELTFFVRRGDLYERFDEWHEQRTFERAVYEQWLDAAGFEVLEVTADFTDAPPTETAERLFFVARKR